MKICPVILELLHEYGGASMVMTSTKALKSSGQPRGIALLCYGCETWSLTLREEQRFWMSHNTELTRIFRLESDEVRREWEKLHDEKLHNLYDLPYIIRVVKSRKMKWAWHVARIVTMRNGYKIWLENLKETHLLGDKGAD
jgi:hypothetical protein